MHWGNHSTVGGQAKEHHTESDNVTKVTASLANIEKALRQTIVRLQSQHTPQLQIPLSTRIMPRKSSRLADWRMRGLKKANTIRRTPHYFNHPQGEIHILPLSSHNTMPGPLAIDDQQEVRGREMVQ